MQIKKSQAFTLMEILVVLFIIGFILAYVGPRLVKNIARSDIAMTKMKISKIRDALIEYKQDVGHYPNKKEGLNVLMEKPAVKGAENWDGPYLNDDDLKDKWGNDFEYNLPPEKYKGKFRYFEIISPGEPGKDKEIADGA